MWPRRQNVTTNSERIDPWDREPSSSCPASAENNWDCGKRTQFDTTDCLVYGWPSTGGVLIHGGADLVILDFLHLDRFKESRRATTAKEEDQFCSELRKAGAKLWRHEADYIEATFDFRERTAKEEEELVLGWPQEGGVWVLFIANERARPKDFGRIHMAHNMEERCRVIEEYGGRFFADPKDCEHLQHL